MLLQIVFSSLSFNDRTAQQHSFLRHRTVLLKLWSCFLKVVPTLRRKIMSVSFNPISTPTINKNCPPPSIDCVSLLTLSRLFELHYAIWACFATTVLQHSSNASVGIRAHRCFETPYQSRREFRGSRQCGVFLKTSHVISRYCIQHVWLVRPHA